MLRKTKLSYIIVAILNSVHVGLLLAKAMGCHLTVDRGYMIQLHNNINAYNCILGR